METRTLVRRRRRRIVRRAQQRAPVLSRRDGGCLGARDGEGLAPLVSGHAIERLLLRLLQRSLRAFLRRRLCLCLRKRDNRLGADGPGRRGALDAHRCRARHARGHRRGQRRGDGNRLGALVARHIREHAVERLFGRRRARARALEPDRFGGRQHAGAQVCGAGRAGHDGRRGVGGGDVARFEGCAVGGAVAVAVTVGVRGPAWGRVGRGRRGGWIRNEREIQSVRPWVSEDGSGIVLVDDALKVPIPRELLRVGQKVESMYHSYKSIFPRPSQ